MRRYFSTGKEVLQRYNKVLLDNQNLWHKILPRQNGSELDFFNKEKHDTAPINGTLGIIWDLLDRGGKRVRPVLMILLAEIYNVSLKDILPLAYMVETVHNATLVIDDIEDSSETRRGQPCVHLKYGIDRSINAGCLGFFLPVFTAVEQILPHQREKLLYMYIQEMKNIHLGLAWDIYWHGNAHSISSLPSEENYIRMVESKTAVLLRIGFACVSILAGLPQEETAKLSQLANLIGTSFQVQDDLLNLRSSIYAKGKGSIGEDITEGKVTLMVLHHIRETQNTRVLQILGQKTKDQNLINEAINAMEKSGSLNYADMVQRATMLQAQQVLESLSGQERPKREVGLVLDELLNREF